MNARSEWPQFRGPGGSGVGTHPRLPIDWSPTRGIAWSTPIPGRSWSSPVISGGRVVVTTVVRPGPGEEPRKGLYFGGERPEPPADTHAYRVLSLDLATGKVLWDRTVHEGIPRTPLHLKNTYGAETPVIADGMVVAKFGGVGLFALDLVSGAVRWRRSLPARKTRFGWGGASSPVVCAGRVIDVDDNEERSEIVATDLRDGKVAWRADRDEGSNWATPFVWSAGGRVDVVVSGSRAVRGYDPEGRERWHMRGMSSIAIPTPIAGGGLLYVTSGYVGDAYRPLHAIRPGPTGDITLPSDTFSSSRVAWSLPTAGPYNPTPVHHDGRLFVLFDRGLASCHDARTGRKLFDRQRLPDSYAFTASPWVAAGRIFCLDESGRCHVLASSDRFQWERACRFSEEDEMCMASPAMSGDRLVIRSASRLVCLRG